MHRGLPSDRKTAARERVRNDNVLLLTQDKELLTADTEPFAVIIVSRVRQARPLTERIALCHSAVLELIERPRTDCSNWLMTVSCSRGRMGPADGRCTKHARALAVWLREFEFSRVTFPVTSRGQKRLKMGRERNLQAHVDRLQVADFSALKP